MLMQPAANDTLGQRFCKSQTIRNSGQVQSFSILGMSIILALGGFIIIFSYTMEPIVGGFQQRFGKGEYRKIRWAMDEKLNLFTQRDREGKEKAVSTIWSGGSSKYPRHFMKDKTRRRRTCLKARICRAKDYFDMSLNLRAVKEA